VIPLGTDMTTENNKPGMQRFTGFINTAGAKILMSPNPGAEGLL
jgi:hypothetical protein